MGEELMREENEGGTREGRIKKEERRMDDAEH